MMYFLFKFVIIDWNVSFFYMYIILYDIEIYVSREKGVEFSVIYMI